MVRRGNIPPLKVARNNAPALLIPAKFKLDQRTFEEVRQSKLACLFQYKIVLLTLLGEEEDNLKLLLEQLAAVSKELLTAEKPTLQRMKLLRPLKNEVAALMKEIDATISELETLSYNLELREFEKLQNAKDKAASDLHALLLKRDFPKELIQSINNYFKMENVVSGVSEQRLPVVPVPAPEAKKIEPLSRFGQFKLPEIKNPLPPRAIPVEPPLKHSAIPAVGRWPFLNKPVNKPAAPHFLPSLHPAGCREPATSVVPEAPRLPLINK